MTHEVEIYHYHTFTITVPFIYHYRIIRLPNRQQDTKTIPPPYQNLTNTTISGPTWVIIRGSTGVNISGSTWANKGVR